MDGDYDDFFSGASTRTSSNQPSVNLSSDYDDLFSSDGMPLETLPEPPQAFEVASPTRYNVITSPVGMRVGKDGKEHMHEGLDLRAPEGAPIFAFAPGVVKKVVRNYQEGTGPGKYVVVQNEDTGEMHKYFHLSKIADDIQVGQKLESNQQFGLSGSTGNSRGPHLHFEVHRQNESGEYKPINPLEAYPEHFGAYRDKATGEQVNLSKILKDNIAL